MNALTAPHPAVFLIRTIVFLASFLLFQLEFITAKIFLPNFGGSYLVWGACMVFFLAVLLLGYIYAHWASWKFPPESYRRWHTLLLLGPLLSFPGHPLPLEIAASGRPLVVDVFLNLLFVIGPVFFALSTMSVLWQAWTINNKDQGSSAYSLFAVSNAGALTALVTYPFLEPVLGLDVQQNIWRALYALMILLQITAVLKTPPLKQAISDNHPPEKNNVRVTLSRIFYAAAPVILFLTVTSLTTAEIAPMPLLWMIPLAIYLATFIACFKSRPWCPLWIKHNSHAAIAGAVVIYFLIQKGYIPSGIMIAALYAAQAVLSLFCHERLYARRPSGRRQMTGFYIQLSLGGFAGGLMATWMAPVLFNSYAEYFLALALITAAAVACDDNRKITIKEWPLIACAIALLLFWPRAFPYYNAWALILIIAGLYKIFTHLKSAALTGVLLLTALSLSFIESAWTMENYIYRQRNYYGIQKVFERTGARFLKHATTVHGAQSLDERTRQIPLTYFSPESPVGEIMNSALFDFKRIAVIGLGTGSLAAYLKSGQSLDFFELDPDVEKTAMEYFTFITNSAGAVRTITGDARRSLRSSQEVYDLIVIDAFSGDSIPVHLLTREAFEEYRKHLSPNGMILVHISNRYITLLHIAAATAVSTGAQVRGKLFDITQRNVYSSLWLAASWEKTAGEEWLSPLQWQRLKDLPARIWTDNHSSLLPYIKWQKFSYDLIHFRPFQW